ncbi:MAG: hypothetical protein PHI85_00655 [Victivallaceae bacterium]|nr:hypothetical protein [Victivallaceae bacterium]
MNASNIETKAKTLIVDGVGVESGHYKTLYTAAAVAASGDSVKVVISGSETTAGFVKSGVSVIFDGGDGTGAYNLNAGIFLDGTLNIVNQTVTAATQFGGDGEIVVETDGALVWDVAEATVNELIVCGKLQVTNDLAVKDMLLDDGSAAISGGKKLSINHLSVLGNSTITGTPDFHGSMPSVYIQSGASLTIDSPAAAVLASGKILLLEGNLNVNGDLSWKTAGGLYRRNDGRNIHISGNLTELDKVTINNGKTLNINAGRIIGSSGANTITIGGESTGKFSTIEFRGNKNTVNLNGNATFTADELVNVSTIKLGDGKNYTDWNGKKVQGWTYFQTQGDISGMSAAGLGITLGKFSLALIIGDCNFVNAAKSSLKIGSGSTAGVGGTLSNLKTISVGNAATYKDETGKKVEMASSLEVGGDVAMAVSGASVSIGKSAEMNVGGYFTMFGTGNKLSLGANSTTAVGGKVLNVNTLNLSSGAVYQGSGKQKIQGRTEFSAAGDVATNGTLNINAGKYTDTGMQGDLSAYKLTVKIGTAAYLSVGGRMFGLSNLNLSSGSKTEKTGAMFGENIGGTTAGDSITTGNNTSLTVNGNLDLEAGSNRLAVGNDSFFRLNGLLANMKTVKVGKNCRLELSTQATRELLGMGKNFSIAAGSVMVDIGDRSAAINFTTAAAERADDTLGSSAMLLDGAGGWLSNKDAYGKVETCGDEIDFFTLGGTLNLNGWEIEGAEGALKVTVYRHNGMAWDAGTAIAESAAGRWDLSGTDLNGAADYRVSVAIAANAERDVYTYTVNQLA